MARVLFVDDEINPAAIDNATSNGDPNEFRGYMSYYIRELEKFGKHEVTPVNDVDDAIALLEKDPDFNVAILDIMMPPGKAFAKYDTFDGMTTGLILAKYIHAQWPKIRIILLSNALGVRSQSPSVDSIEDLIEHGVAEELLFKLQSPPSDLLSHVGVNHT